MTARYHHHARNAIVIAACSSLRPGAGDYLRPARKEEPAGGGRAKDRKKKPLPLRYFFSYSGEMNELR